MKSNVSISTLSFRLVEKLVFSPVFWIFVASLLMMIANENATTLFGTVNNSIPYSFSFSPWHAQDPNCFSGFCLFTYPIAHANWSHWFNSAFLWLILGLMFESRIKSNERTRQKFARTLLLLIFYGGASVAIASSYRLQWASVLPTVQENDRILGLSGLDFFILGNLVFLRRTIKSCVLSALLIGATYSLFFVTAIETNATTNLSHFGHGMGFFIGSISALVLRFGFPNAIVTNGSHPSYQR